MSYSYLVKSHHTATPFVLSQRLKQIPFSWFADASRTRTLITSITSRIDQSNVDTRITLFKFNSISPIRSETDLIHSSLWSHPHPQFTNRPRFYSSSTIMSSAVAKSSLKGNSSKSTTSSSSATNTSPHGCIRVDKSGSLMLHVEVKPGVKEWQMTLESDHLHVRLAAPPIDGQANKALVEYLADQLSLKKSSLSVVAGTTSKTKTIGIELTADSGSGKPLTADILMQRLQKAIQDQ